MEEYARLIAWDACFKAENFAWEKFKVPSSLREKSKLMPHLFVDKHFVLMDTVSCYHLFISKNKMPQQVSPSVMKQNRSPCCAPTLEGLWIVGF